jgi:hypothetical protein
VCERVECAIQLTLLDDEAMSVDFLTSPCFPIDSLEWSRHNIEKRHKSTLAVMLAHKLISCDWFPHQHSSPVDKFEEESIPATLSEPELVVLQRLQTLMDKVCTQQPQPMIAAGLHPLMDDDRCVPLVWLSDVRPRERSPSSTTSATAHLLWKAIVGEIASHWASVCVAESYGLLFIGPKERLMYWPEHANDLLAYLHVAFPRIIDLFTIATAFGVKIDLKSAYRSILLTASDARYMGALLDGVPIKFSRLPFGLCQAPALFVALLTTTIVRYKSNYPDAYSILVQYMDDSGIGGLSITETLLSAERLLSAFIADGWWISAVKSFLHPCVALVFTGFIADFPDFSVRIAQSKTTKLMTLLRDVKRPPLSAPALVPRTTNVFHAPIKQPHRVPCTLESSLLRAAVTPGVYILDILCVEVPTWPRAPALILTCPGFRPSALLDLEVTSTVPNSMLVNSFLVDFAYLNYAQTILIYMDPSLVEDVIMGLPRALTDIHSFIFNIALSVDTVPEYSAILFSPCDVLPSWIASTRRRPLPPAETMCFAPRENNNFRLDGPSFYSLRKALGLIAWFQSILGFLGFIRGPLDRLLGSRRWDDHANQALDTMLTITNLLPRWGRRMHLPQATLTVISDAGLAWGAVVPTSKGPVYLAGALPPRLRLASSSAREAAALRSAVRAAFGLKVPFDAVVIILDSTVVVDTAKGSSRSHDVATCLISIASWEIQGLHVDVKWQRRSSGLHPLADALSAASPTHIWTLRVPVLSYIWDLTGGWDIDIASNQECSTTSAYATCDVEATRRSCVLKDMRSFGSSPSTRIGWMGQMSDASIGADDVAFAFPPWSALPVLAARMKVLPFSLLLVAPFQPGTEWWSPAFTFLTSLKAGPPVPIGSSASVPPVEFRGPRPKDPRTLTLWSIGPSPTVFARPRTRPSWWSPWLLTACGDVEANPGPVSFDELFCSTRSCTLDPDINTPATEFLTVPVLGTETTRVIVSLSSRVRGCKRSCHSKMSFDDLFIRPLSSQCVRLSSTDQDHPHCPDPIPPPVIPLFPVIDLTTMTMGDWIDRVNAFSRGKLEVATGAEIPLSLVSSVQYAASVVRYKSLRGSSRPLRVVRNLSITITSFDIRDHPFSLATVEATVIAYVVSRLRDTPPAGWQTITPSGLLHDASAIAGASRRAGYPIPQHCGSRVYDFLAARGATEKQQHSAAWPIHLYDLLAKPVLPTELYFREWTALIVMAFFCLRDGVLPFLTAEMFFRYDDGWVLVWRHISKTASGDVLNPVVRSKIFYVTAARHPILDSLLSRPSLLSRSPLFPGITCTSLNRFVSTFVTNHSCPFDRRAYGVRVAADSEAIELKTPAHLIDAMFWWKRKMNAGSKAYYSGLNISRMLRFSEYRIHLQFNHLTPGRYDCRSSAALPPDWDTIVSSSSTLPVLNVQALELAWGATSDELIKRKTGASIGRIPTMNPFTPPPISESDSVASDARSLDCGLCARHISRHRRGTLCEQSSCTYGVCTLCHPDLSVEVWCPRHLL